MTPAVKTSVGRKKGAKPDSAQSPGLELGKDRLKAGDSLQGKLTKAGERAINLLLIGKDGVVYNFGGLLKKAAGVDKGAATPNKAKVGQISRTQLRDIAQTKMKDLNATTIEAAERIVEGAARSMGITVAS